MRKRGGARLGVVLGIALVVAVIGAVYLVPWRGGNTSPVALTRIVLQLPWRHSGAFAGYYAADQNGGYGDAGIEIGFREGGGPVDPIDAVLQGKAQFGIATGNHLLQARAKGLPVRAIAAIHQLNPIVFVALEQSGITHPRQFRGKVIRSSRTNLPVLQALAKRFGIEPDAYSIVETNDTEEAYRRFYRGEIDVLTGFHFWTRNKLAKDGKKAVFMYPDDYGIHFYRDSIFTTDDFIAANPRVVENFLRATLVQGWRFALERPDRSGPMTLAYRPEADPDHATAFLTAMLPLINNGQVPVGWMRPETWAHMAETLKGLDLLPAELDPEEVYTMRFVRAVYAGR